MLAIPTALQSKFDEQLQIKAVPIALHELYKKWYYSNIQLGPKKSMS
jgi:hypothetical protein